MSIVFCIVLSFMLALLFFYKEKKMMNKDKVRRLENDIHMNQKIMHKLQDKMKSLEFTNKQKRKELDQIKSKQRKSVL
jgi:hypothetical protein